MSLIGSELEMGGHAWRVASVRREGPEWRVVLKTLAEGAGTMTARTEGVDPPTTLGDLRHALQRPESRTFLDELGARWRAEVIPDYGSPNGANVMVLSAEMSSDRHKLAYTSLASLAVLTDGDPRKSLEAARRMHATG